MFVSRISSFDAFQIQSLCKAYAVRFDPLPKNFEGEWYFRNSTGKVISEAVSHRPTVHRRKIHHVMGEDDQGDDPVLHGHGCSISIGEVRHSEGDWLGWRV